MVRKLYCSVHPHTRGKHSTVAGAVVCGAGSSPHAGEILVEPFQVVVIVRFIPTRRGNTPHAHTGVVISAVHPHTRGKYCGSVHSPDDSSVHPHTRGKYSRYFITKAPGPSPHAGGNTRRQTGRPGLPAVHPHTRGKYFMFIRVLISSSGPSPHAGEIPSRTRWSAEPDRFIPTRRGNTRIHQLIIQNGSSPHAGEIRQYNDVKQVLKRFIPTRGENTNRQQ